VHIDHNVANPKFLAHNTTLVDSTPIVISIDFSNDRDFNLQGFRFYAQSMNNLRSYY